MEISWLETFIALTETGSLRSAAGSLGLSPATVSERINMLETEIGTKLLERTSKGSELTDAGIIFREKALNILSDWQNICDVTKQMNTSRFRHLSLGMPGDIMAPGVGHFLDQFIRRHSQIELSLYSDMNVGIAESLRTGLVDVFFAFEPSAETRQGMVCKPVHHTSMGVILPSDHRLAFRDSLSLKELDGETFVLYPGYGDSSIYSIQREILKKSGINYIEYGGRFSPALYVLTGKIGCGIVMCPGVRGDRIPPRMVYIPLSDDGAGVDICMLYDPSNTNPSLKLFLDEIGDLKGADQQ